MRTKKKVTEAVEKRVAALLVQDREYTAKELKREVEKSLKKDGKNYKFTERTYNNIKNRILPNISSNNPLDKEWSLGACEEYRIPNSLVPLLIEYSKLISRARQLDKQYFSDEKFRTSLEAHIIEWPVDMEDIPTSMTIRQVRWMSHLNALVEKLREKYKNDEIDSKLTLRKYAPFWLLYQVAEVYADMEKISESLGNEHFDTTEIDDLLFNQDYPTYNNFYWAIYEIDLKQMLYEDVQTNKGRDQDEIKGYILKVKQKEQAYTSAPNYKEAKERQDERPHRKEE
jgi:hypothetical protein